MLTKFDKKIGNCIDLKIGKIANLGQTQNN